MWRLSLSARGGGPAASAWQPEAGISNAIAHFRASVSDYCISTTSTTPSHWQAGIR